MPTKGLPGGGQAWQYPPEYVTPACQSWCLWKMPPLYSMGEVSSSRGRLWAIDDDYLFEVPTGKISLMKQRKYI